MSDTFIFLECTDETIQKQKFICFYVLNFEKHIVFRIFKKFTDEMEDKITDLAMFEDITDRISFAIKRDGKIALDIKI